MKKIIIMFIIPLLISSCRKKCEDHHTVCNPEQLSWLLYNGSESVIFQRNDGVFDTAFRQNHFYEAELHPASMDGRECAYYTEIYYNDLNGKHIIAGLVINAQDNDEHLFTIDTFTQFSIGGTPQNNISIHGITYNNVYEDHVPDTTYFATLNNSKAWRVYYSKSYGLLRVDRTKGVFWERIN